VIDTTKAHYLDLEQKLHTLRTHFTMCKGADNKEVLDWAKFFLGWSKAASQQCGSWTVENLRNIENFAKNLEKSKVGVMGYEVLESMMGEAAVSLNCEILAYLHKGKVPKPEKERAFLAS